jgi:hypothetical protein
MHLLAMPPSPSLIEQNKQFDAWKKRLGTCLYYTNTFDTDTYILIYL